MGLGRGGVAGCEGGGMGGGVGMGHLLHSFFLHEHCVVQDGFTSRDLSLGARITSAPGKKRKYI